MELAPSEQDLSEVFTFDDDRALHDPGWISVRSLPSTLAASHAGRPGQLTLTVEDTPLTGIRPAFIGRRVRHLTSAVTATIDVSAGVGGVVARLSEDHYLAVEAAPQGQTTRVTARAHLAGLEHTVSADLPGGPVTLGIEATPPPRGFSPDALGGDRVRLTASVAGHSTVLAELDGRYWTYETAKCFTGRVTGFPAVSGTVQVSDFRYHGTHAEGGRS